ncbi:hypothetical protein MPSEU_000667900 [Mayamaea pseudoterrestris]|nr:hypothetical protein MPSEU_000667900 [Mayamaea pseudoterrestris]
MDHPFEYCVDSYGKQHFLDGGDYLITSIVAQETGHTGWSYFYDVMGALVCICFVALVSGLFMGLMTMDPLDLNIIIRVGSTEEEVAQANELLPIVEQHHRVLVTLLLLNAVAYEALPLFMDNLVPRMWAIAVSVSCVLLFGEIVPCAIFIGPNQLELASKLIGVMKFFMKVTYPIAYPLAKLLDRIVGSTENEDHYSREELSALIRIQYEEQATLLVNRKSGFMANHHKNHQARIVKQDQRTWRALKKEILEAVQERAEEADEQCDEDLYYEQMDPPLAKDEINMVEGALSMKTKLTMDVYTPLRMMYALPHDLILDRENLMRVYSTGYSRIPVYRRQPDRPDDCTAIYGVLMTRHLMVIDWDDERPANSLPLQRPPCVSPRMNLVKLISLLKDNGSHIAFVCARPDVAKKALDREQEIPPEAGFMGLVTLEDVLEELIQDTILDERDYRDRELEAARLTRWAATKLQEWYKKKKKLKRISQTGVSFQPSIDETLDLENGVDDPSSWTPLLDTKQNGHEESGIAVAAHASYGTSDDEKRVLTSRRP